MKTFTNAEIRGAILRAADTLESNPKLFNFWLTQVPPCGSPGCVIGHIGQALGLEHNVFGFNKTVDVLMGGENGEKHLLFYPTFEEITGAYIGSTSRVSDLARAMRKYADTKYPAAEQKALSTWVRQDVTDWSSCAWRPNKASV